MHVCIVVVSSVNLNTEHSLCAFILFFSRRSSVTGVEKGQPKTTNTLPVLVCHRNSSHVHTYTYNPHSFPRSRKKVNPTAQPHGCKKQHPAANFSTTHTTFKINQSFPVSRERERERPVRLLRPTYLLPRRILQGHMKRERRRTRKRWCIYNSTRPFKTKDAAISEREREIGAERKTKTLGGQTKIKQIVPFLLIMYKVRPVLHTKARSRAP